MKPRTSTWLGLLALIELSATTYGVWVSDPFAMTYAIAAIALAVLALVAAVLEAARELRPQPLDWTPIVEVGGTVNLDDDALDRLVDRWQNR